MPPATTRVATFARLLVTSAGMIALTGPSSHFAAWTARECGAAAGPSSAHGSRRCQRRRSDSAGHSAGARCPAIGRRPASPPQPRVIRFPTDNTGVPARPPSACQATRQIANEVAKDVTNLVEMVKDPEAEISLVEGQTRIIQTRRELSRIVIANPLVADIELLTDQPGSRLLNLTARCPARPP